MEKRVKTNNGECVLKMSAAVPRMYRQTFNEDIITGMQDMQERLAALPAEERSFAGGELTMLENLAYICSIHADPDQSDDVGEWLERFTISDIDSLMGEAIIMWTEDNKQLSTAKKKTEEQ